MLLIAQLYKLNFTIPYKRGESVYRGGRVASPVGRFGSVRFDSVRFASIRFLACFFSSTNLPSCCRWSLFQAQVEPASCCSILFASLQDDSFQHDPKVESFNSERHAAAATLLFFLGNLYTIFTLPQKNKHFCQQS
ncbi:hypothetical protein SAMN05444162_3236 [Paenibacillaceae bacterium GAS479]|nr:hypothetical protein SAMN05444162_3236 [Paenibacillaceae bacterium GAS479]